jgi:phosphoribosylanthranilate isomerase
MAEIKLKICGITTISEAEALKNTRISYIGLNFVPSSPRCISLETAQDILAVLRGSGIQTVALFRDQPLDMVEEYARELSVDYVQLHGDEPAEYARALQTPVIKAIAVKPDSRAGELIKLVKNYPADYFVLDRHEQGKGDIIDSGLAAQVIAPAPDKVCLAGGLTPDNLDAVLTKIKPYAIDISSGVRTGDAIDMDKVNRCLEIIRAARSSRPRSGRCLCRSVHA